VRGVVEREDQHNLSCRTCYLIKDHPKHEGFDRFWELLEQMYLDVRGYFGQTIYIFNRLAELSFDKGKPHNASLIAEIRVIMTTLEYDTELEVDIIMRIFQIRILLKRSRFFTTEHTD